MATLIGASVPLVDALTVVIQQAGESGVEIVLRDVREKVMHGRSLAEALAHHPRYFSPMYVNMVRAGEASGKLADIFESLAAFHERRAALKGKLVAALLYPAILAVVGLGVVIFLVTSVVPRFADLLQRAHHALPLPTVILMSVSGFLRHHFWVLLLGLGVLAAVWAVARRNERLRFGLDRLTLRIPILGDLARKQAVASFATTLATLLASGIRVNEALGIARGVMENRVFARAVDELQLEINGGRDIATTLRKGDLFPPMVAYMIAVGEKTGQLDAMLRRVAESYEREIQITAQKLVAVLEPAIVVAMAGVVAFIVAAILLPILSLSRIGF